MKLNKEKSSLFKYGKGLAVVLATTLCLSSCAVDDEQEKEVTDTTKKIVEHSYEERNKENDTREKDKVFAPFEHIIYKINEVADYMEYEEQSGMIECPEGYELIDSDLAIYSRTPMKIFVMETFRNTTEVTVHGKWDYWTEKITYSDFGTPTELLTNNEESNVKKLSK